VDLELYRMIEKKYGDVASWAIWEPAGIEPKSNISVVDILDPNKNEGLFSTIKTNIAMVGLSFSRSVKFNKPFQNFHDSHPYANDFKIRFAFEDSPFYGAYMTDVIKNLEMLSSKDVVAYLNNNKGIIANNIEFLKEELKTIGAEKPIILAFGRDCYKLLKENLDESIYSHLIKLTHYSHYISKEDYKEKVFKEIKKVMGSIP
jgi:hypothetical protein